jgi:hypothetical protein
MKHRVEMELECAPSEVMSFVNGWVKLTKDHNANAEFVAYRSADPQAQVILATGVSALSITGES